MNSLKRVCAYSANAQNSLANSVANEEVAVIVNEMLDTMGTIEDHAKAAAQEARTHLSAFYETRVCSDPNMQVHSEKHKYERK